MAAQDVSVLGNQLGTSLFTAKQQSHNLYLQIIVTDIYIFAAMAFELLFNCH